MRIEIVVPRDEVDEMQKWSAESEMLRHISAAHLV